jgi:hypothetical protein
MRFASRTLLAAVIAVGAASCGGDDGGPQNLSLGDPFFPADFLQTYTMVRNCRTSVEHDLFMAQVYINPEAAAAYMNGTYPFPQGTVCVKPLYTDANCTTIHEYAAMRKGAPGTTPAGGDWEWQTVGADGKVRQTDAGRCLGCHEDCTVNRQFPAGRDFTCTDE